MVKPRGLNCDIFKNSLYRNCANGGLSERVRTVTLVVEPNVAEGLSLPFEPDEDAPAVKIVERFFGHERYVHAEPINPPPKGMVGWCMGGTYIHTSDSRWRKITGVDYPIALHDRCDTPEDFEMLTR